MPDANFHYDPDEMARVIDALPVDQHITVQNQDGNIYRVNKMRDDDPENPCDCDINLGTMVCWHRNYNLGNIQPKTQPKKWIQEILKEKIKDNPMVLYDYLSNGDKSRETRIIRRNNPDGQGQRWTLFYGSMIDSPNDVFAIDVKDPKDPGEVPSDFLDACVEEMHTSELIDFLNQHDYLFMALYLMDHSGLSISVEDFGDHWDSGQVGWIYTTRKTAENLWGAPWDEHRARQELKEQVREYDKYLRNDYYGISVYEFNPWDSEDPEDANDFELKQIETVFGFGDAQSMEEFVHEIIGPYQIYNYDPKQHTNIIEHRITADWPCVFCGKKSVTGRLVGHAGKFYGTCKNCGAIYHQ